jgi:curved DNA-binding protein CbpA
MEIKTAYQDMVRKYSPEKFPEIHKRLQAAYEKIKDKKARAHYEYFSMDMVDKYDLCAHILSDSSNDLAHIETHLNEYFQTGLNNAR